MTSEAHIIYDAATLIAVVAVDMPIPGAIVADVSVSEARARSADAAAVSRWITRHGAVVVQTEDFEGLVEFRRLKPAARAFQFEYAAISDIMNRKITSGGRVALYVDRASSMIAIGSRRDHVRIIKISGSLSARSEYPSGEGRLMFRAEVS